MCQAPVKLWASYRHKNWKLECVDTKSFDNVDISEKNFKSAMLTKFYP